MLPSSKTRVESAYGTNASSYSDAPLLRLKSNNSNGVTTRGKKKTRERNGVVIEGTLTCKMSADTQHLELVKCGYKCLNDCTASDHQKWEVDYFTPAGVPVRLKKGDPELKFEEAATTDKKPTADKKRARAGPAQLAF